MSEPATPGSLSGQVIVVLGTSQALPPVARALAHLGAQVIVAEPSDTGPDTETLIQSEGGLARYLRTDPDDEASLAALAALTQAAFGPIDVVITLPPEVERTPILQLTTAHWDRLVTRPLRRAISVSQAFLPAMLTRGQGTLLQLVYDASQPHQTASSAAQHGLMGFTQALAAEVQPQGVRVLAVSAPTHAHPAQLAGAVAYLLASPAHTFRGPILGLEAVLDRAGFAQPHADSEAASPLAPTRVASLAHAVTLSQQLAALLMDTDSEFDRLPISVRPMARGAFMSQVGYRSQAVLRAMHKLGEQLQRMQASHSGTDTEFQVDFPRLAELLDRLLTYYQHLPDDTAALTADQPLVAQLRRQTAERAALIQSLLAALHTVRDA